jgi:4-aminobutyrate aminotransferase-like enzyme
VEFGQPNAPDKDAAKAVQKACLEHNLLLLTCGSYENTIRLIPPLVIDTAQADAALAVFAEAVGRV